MRKAMVIRIQSTSARALGVEKPPNIRHPPVNSVIDFSLENAEARSAVL
jgi:hypothetical protein